jgi:hypothetical protein
VYRGSGIDKTNCLDITSVKILIGGTPITKEKVNIDFTIVKGDRLENCCGCGKSPIGN